ncbi:hypothetical protein ACSBOX_11945 [Arthrobacter sp. KN11-1C]|uniref:hypothetical protein n=1 Tax=Arthrobacter sp. KN11-1C TaxID=3445774 RepID=UPI003F9FD6A6
MNMHTDMPRTPLGAINKRVDSGVRLGVLEDRERCVAAEFHGAARTLFTASRIRDCPTAVEPVKEILRGSLGCG